MTRRRLLPSLSIAVSLASCGEDAALAGARHAGPDLRQAVAAIEEALGDGEAPGAVLLVGRGDEVLLQRALGARAVEPAAEEMSADTVFDLASLTKPVATATSVMKLVDQGRLRLAAPVAEYLPEFGARGKEAITVEHLLLHRGGLIPDNPLADYEGTPEQAWERICTLEPRSPPGARFVYTDVGFIVLGELVRRVDGRPLERFAAEELFLPLGMRDTTFLPGPELTARCAPTAFEDGRWLRGEVHDPRARRLGGVAGHAGLFSTAADLARWCRMLLGGGELEGVRVLSSETVRGMTRARWLSDGSGGRALGLDADTGYSSPRGAVFPRGASFGHTGFTGTSLWIDPETQGYVILLTSRLHPDGKGNVIGVRRAVGTAVGRALRPAPVEGAVLAGVDVLAREECARLRGRRVGLVTNVTGRTREGERTIDVLARAEGLELVSLFTPEHGYLAAQEGDVEHAVDEATGLPVHSLYGETRRPTAEMLAGLDTLVFDVQDVGVRFYTYATTLAYAMEAAAEHGLTVVVLDRPNPITGLRVAGPLADEERLSFIAYRPLPVVHGMTIGELARMFRSAFGVACELEVVPCEGWRREMWWDETGLPWVDPSPNLRNPTQAALYPALGLLEGANLSVGRGTDEPFERLGAPWIDGRRLAAALNAAALPGLRFTPLSFTPEASPFAGERCEGVHVTLTEREAFRPVAAGLAIAWHLNRLFPRDFEVAKADARMLSHGTWEALMRCGDPAALPETWAAELAAFRELRAGNLLYE